MKLDLPIRTFNSFGGSFAFAPVLALIELCEEEFGTGLQKIEVTLCFISKLPFSEQGVDPSLQASFKCFHNYCTHLPKRRFLRKQATLKIEALAEFASAEEINRPRKEACLKWLPPVLEILISELEQCRGKFKASDDFRVDDYLKWLRAQHKRLPKTQRAAKKLVELFSQKEEDETSLLSDWDRLGLNWKDFHENARNVVSDPRLWSRGHDFAPNGNDNGADLLTRFRAQKSRSARNEGKSFYKKLQKEWGFDPQAKPGDSAEYDLKREVVVGLAFAFLKLFAYCPTWLAEEAIGEIKAYEAYLATNHLDWQHRDQCLEYQELMLSCLLDCPRAPLLLWHPPR